MIITAKINVNQIDKSKLYEGAKGKYLNIVLIATPEGKYGDFMVVQQVSQEERAQNIRGAILGNGKFIRGKPGEARPQGSRRPDTRPAPAAQQELPPAEDDSDVPF